MSIAQDILQSVRHIWILVGNILSRLEFGGDQREQSWKSEGRVECLHGGKRLRSSAGDGTESEKATP